MKVIKPIGLIRTPFTSLKDMPIQPKGAQEIMGKVEVHNEYKEGLEDLSGFSHIYLLYQFHLSTKVQLKVIPFMDSVLRGIFATRSPLRPNHIGLSIVTLVEQKSDHLIIQGADMIDQTPLLDIKPYIEAFDSVSDSKSGWMKHSQEAVCFKRSDDRFIE